MKVLAIIPARGGSKGIINKNIQKIGGLPLIKHTIISAKKSKTNVAAINESLHKCEFL